MILALNGIGRLTGFPWSSFDPDSITNDAQRETGLDDLGEGSYRDGLEAFCDAIPRESRLSPVGRISARKALVGTLANRLRVIDWARRHPDVSSERIDRPWIIVGLPRTGTSLLSFLMELDPHSRTPTQWEALDPMPPPDLATHTTDPRIAAAARQFSQLTRLCPPLNALHPMDAGLAAEDVSILMYTLHSFQFETLAFTPTYGRWLDAADMRPAYEFFKGVLQIWQSTIPTDAWSLKCPQHLGNLEALLSVFPDARIIWIHRDPASALPSVASMMMAYLLMSSSGLDPVRVGGYWCDRLARTVDRAMDFDDAARPDGWCRHIHYDQLMKDPVGTVRDIYSHFGESPEPLHERRVELFMQNRPRDHYGRHVYRLDDFGMTTRAIDERFETYRQRYGASFEGR